jgi:phospholipid/cholesterol/gamma-HCH transport system permease protein
MCCACCAHRCCGPWRDISGHLYNMGAMALPITALVGFLIGVVLAYLMALQLRQFGAESFIVNILGISLIRELGPLLAPFWWRAQRLGHHGADRRDARDRGARRHAGHGHSPGLPPGAAACAGAGAGHAADQPVDHAGRAGRRHAGGGPDHGHHAAYFLQSLPARSSRQSVAGHGQVGGVWRVDRPDRLPLGPAVEPNTQSLGQGTTASVVSSITMVIMVDAVFAILFRNVGF